MLQIFMIRRFSETRQVSFIKKHGFVLGTCSREGRQAYLYNYGDMFVEIIYQNDNPDEPAEKLVWVNGFDNLKRHLDKEYLAVA